MRWSPPPSPISSNLGRPEPTDAAVQKASWGKVVAACDDVPPAFLPALAIMIVLNNVAEEIGWTGFVFAQLQDRHGPLRAALLTTLFFWLFHVPSTYVETRSWATTALVLGIFLLPPWPFPP